MENMKSERREKKKKTERKENKIKTIEKSLNGGVVWRDTNGVNAKIMAA